MSSPKQGIFGSSQQSRLLHQVIEALKTKKTDSNKI